MLPGKVTAGQLTALIAKHRGTATLKTVQGDRLKFTRHGNGIMITDGKGGTAMVTTANVNQSNGVVHVIDSVLLP